MVVELEDLASLRGIVAIVTVGIALFLFIATGGFTLVLGLSVLAILAVGTYVVGVRLFRMLTDPNYSFRGPGGPGGGGAP